MTALLALSLLVWGLRIVLPGERLALDSRVPDVRMRSIAGESLRLSDFAGRPYLLTFYLQGCPVCEAELPLLAGWAWAHPEVPVLLVYQGSSHAELQAYLVELPVDLPPNLYVVPDPLGWLAWRFRVSGLPLSYTVDGEGLVRYSRVGGPARPYQLDAYFQASGLSR